MGIIENLKKINMELRHKILDNTLEPFDEESISKRVKGNFLVRNVFKLATLHYRVKLLNEPEMDKDKNYIFASTHSYENDIITNICYTKKNMYLLMGGTDQILTNPLIPATALNGIIRIDILDKDSRKSISSIVEKVLKHTSLLMFPEGAYCDSENLYHESLFSSMYDMSVKSKVEVIPIINFLDMSRNKTYIKYGKPIKAWEMTKEEFMNNYKEQIATNIHEIIFNYVKPIKTKSFDIRNYIPKSILSSVANVMSKFNINSNKLLTPKSRIIESYNDVEKYFAQRYKQYAGDDTERGWIENLYYYRDLSQYNPCDYVDDLKNIYKDNPDRVSKYSFISEESGYYKKHNFREYAKEKTGYELKDPLKDPIFLLSKKIGKMFDTKYDLVEFILKSMYTFEKGEFDLIINNIVLETENYSVDELIFYILNEYIGLDNKEEVIYNVDCNYSMMLRKKQNQDL